MPSPETGEDLKALWSDLVGLYSADHALMDEVVGVYHGQIPEKYKELFHDEEPIHLINMIRMSWDDLANLAGKEFPLYVRPENDKATKREQAEKIEKVGYSWNRAGRLAGGVSMKALMKVFSWWLAGTGNAVAMALPDYKHKSPFFTFRDPRTYYPPAGTSPFTQAAPDDAFFAYELPLKEIAARYPEQAAELEDIAKAHKTTTFWVGEYYSAGLWLVATMTGRSVELLRSEDGDRGHPGVNPVVPFSIYTGGGPKARSMYADQISLQAAVARMISQKIAFFDRALYPLVFHTPLAGKTIRIGPYATNEFDTTGNVPPRVDVVGPAQNVDADQTIGFAISIMRVLGRNPENMQGAGPADSAKAIDALRASVTQTIQEGLWPAFMEGLPKLYEAAARMDVTLWGDVRKKAAGSRKNTPFTIPYTPNSLIRGRETDFEIEPGVGLAGYQGTLEILQVYGGELMSDETAFEQLESVTNAQEERRRVQKMRIERLTLADLGAMAEQGRLAPGALPEVRRRTAAGEDMFDVMEEMDKEGRLVLEPPAMPGMGPGGPPGGGPPGMPPGLEQLALGPGGMEPPPLEAIRG